MFLFYLFLFLWIDIFVIKEWRRENAKGRRKEWKRWKKEIGKKGEERKSFTLFYFRCCWSFLLVFTIHETYYFNVLIILYLFDLGSKMDNYFIYLYLFTQRYCFLPIFFSLFNVPSKKLIISFLIITLLSLFVIKQSEKIFITYL